MDIMDTRRSKLLCNNTNANVHKKHISLVRYMIVLSCARGIFLHQKKKCRILLISGVNYFPALRSPAGYAPAVAAD